MWDNFCVCCDNQKKNERLRVYRFLDFMSIGVTVGRANVNNADEIPHALAQIQQTIGPFCVHIDGHFQRLDETHGGRAVKNNVNALYQHLLVLGMESHVRQAHVALKEKDLVQHVRKVASYLVENLRNQKTHARFALFCLRNNMRTRKKKEIYPNYITILKTRRQQATIVGTLTIATFRRAFDTTLFDTRAINEIFKQRIVQGGKVESISH